MLAGSLTLALGLAELVVRLVAPQQLILIRPDLYEPADTFGFVRRPNLHSRINTGERTVDLITDRDGLRVGAAGRVEAGTRILLIGDSFVEALQVQYEQSLAGLIEHELPRRLGRPVAVRDAGVGGWRAPECYYAARKLLARDRYDLVVVAVYVGRDPVDRFVPTPPREPSITRYPLRLPQRFAASEFVDAFLRPLNDFLKVRSQLYIMVRTRLRTLRMRLGLYPLEIPIVFYRSEVTSPLWEVTAQIYQDLAGLARSAGAPTLFVLIPADLQVDRESFMEFLRGYGVDSAALDVDQPQRLLHEAMVGRGLRVVDPLPVMRTVQAGGTPMHGRVDSHLTREGHEVLWHFLEPTLIGYLRVPAGPHAPAPGHVAPRITP